MKTTRPPLYVFEFPGESPLFVPIYLAYPDPEPEVDDGPDPSLPSVVWDFPLD